MTLTHHKGSIAGISLTLARLTGKPSPRIDTDGRKASRQATVQTRFFYF